MAREEAEPTFPSGEEPRSGEVERERPGKRQRAVDLFSPHRYRDLQVKLFERKKPDEGFDAIDAGWEDDVADPPLTSDSPAARSAREVVAGSVHSGEHSVLSPVSEWDFPEDAADESVEDGGDAAEVFAGSQYTPADDDDAADAEEADDPADGSDADEAADVEADADSEGETKPAKSSRNFLVATLVGLLLLGATVGTAWYHPTAFAVLLYGFCLAAVIEWRRALAHHGRRVPRFP